MAGTSSVGLATATSWLHRSNHLVHALPRTFEALDDGWLRVPHALVLCEETLLLTPALCAAVETATLDEADGRTPGGFRRYVRRIILRLQDAEAVEKRRQEAFAARRVSTRSQPDGMATVWADMTAQDEQRFSAALRQLADLAGTPGDDRTAEQRQADVLALLPELVLSAYRSSDDASGGLRENLLQALASHGFPTSSRTRPVQVVVLVPAATALGRSDAPAELVGYGPISAGHARSLLVNAELRKAVVDEHGRIVAVEDRVERPVPGRRLDTVREMAARPTPQQHQPEPQHDPSPALSRLVRLRDLTCVGPGSDRSSERCDREHRIPWPRGTTSAANLAPVSRYWHRAKQAGWVYIRSRDGTTTWISPLGRTYLIPADRWPPPRHAASHDDDDVAA